MKEAFGDIWDLAKETQGSVGICITTNGYVRKDGKAVMGRGIAKEAAERYPWLPRTLAEHIRYRGNGVAVWGADYDPDTDKSTHIISFPVKPVFGPNGQMGWQAKAELNIIKASAIELMDIPKWLVPKTILLPRPGCGNGGLKWEDVKPVIEPILDDRVTVVTWHP